MQGAGSVDRVTVAGRIRRDYLGRPEQLSSATIEPLPKGHRVTVAEMGGALEGGPDSIEWLKEQRGR